MITVNQVNIGDLRWINTVCGPRQRRLCNIRFYEISKEVVYQYDSEHDSNESAIETNESYETLEECVLNWRPKALAYAVDGNRRKATELSVEILNTLD